MSAGRTIVDHPPVVLACGLEFVTSLAIILSFNRMNPHPSEVYSISSSSSTSPHARDSVGFRWRTAPPVLVNSCLTDSSGHLSADVALRSADCYIRSFVSSRQQHRVFVRRVP